MDLTSLGWILVILFSAWWWGSIIFSSNRNAKLYHQQQELMAQLAEIIHQVKVEYYDGIEYWFDSNTNKFLGQGYTFDEVADTLKVRFPSHVFLIEDQGGVAHETDWKILEFDEFKKINFNPAQRKLNG